jgi:hypothetical protein
MLIQDAFMQMILYIEVLHQNEIRLDGNKKSQELNVKLTLAKHC